MHLSPHVRTPSLAFLACALLPVISCCPQSATLHTHPPDALTSACVAFIRGSCCWPPLYPGLTPLPDLTCFLPTCRPTHLLTLQRMDLEQGGAA